MVVVLVAKKRNGVLIIFDNAEEILIPSALYTNLYLVEDDELDNKKFTAIKKEVDIYKIKQNAYRYLSGRNHSSFELKLKLIKKKYDKQLIEIVLADLEVNNYLNDEEFALNYFKYQKNKNKGLLKIKSELFRKGIDRNIIDGIIPSENDQNDFFNSAKALAQKKALQLSKRKIDKIKMSSRIYQTLLNKGFTTDIISQVMKEINLKGNIDEI